MTNLVCPFCQDYPDPVDFSDTKGVFMSTNQPDLTKHIYDIHDDGRKGRLQQVLEQTTKNKIKDEDVLKAIKQGKKVTRYEEFQTGE